MGHHWDFGDIALIIFVTMGCILVWSWLSREASLTESLMDGGKKKQPILPSSPREEDFRESALDALRDKREDIYDAFREGGLKGHENAAQACERWRQYACRQKSVAALALAAALSRLCPEAPPNGKPQARLEELLHLAGNGEGHFLLGISHLSLYEHI